MAVPTSYTELEVGQYMESVLGDTAAKLGWTYDAGDFDEAIVETLLLLGQTDFTFVSTAALAAQVRAVARMEVWRTAMYSTVHEASFSVGSPGTGQVSRADIHRQAKAMFEMAEKEVKAKYPTLAVDETQEVTGYGVRYANDVYSRNDDA